jgi:hypothetical protein
MEAGRTLLVVLLLGAPAGCSFVLVQGPPPKDENAPRPLFDSECTTSKFAPVVDTVLAAMAGGMLVGTLMASTMGTPPPNQTPAERDASRHQAMVIGIGALAVGIVPTISAIWGFHTVRKCREYEEGPWRRSRRPPVTEPDEQADTGD